MKNFSSNISKFTDTHTHTEYIKVKAFLLCGYTAGIIGIYMHIKDGTNKWQMRVLCLEMQPWLLPMEIASVWQHCLF